MRTRIAKPPASLPGVPLNPPKNAPGVRNIVRKPRLTKKLPAKPAVKPTQKGGKKKSGR